MYTIITHVLSTHNAKQRLMPLSWRAHYKFSAALPPPITHNTRRQPEYNAKLLSLALSLAWLKSAAAHTGLPPQPLSATFRSQFCFCLTLWLNKFRSVFVPLSAIYLLCFSRPQSFGEDQSRTFVVFITNAIFLAKLHYFLPCDILI